jgi:hypothetical protein
VAYAVGTCVVESGGDAEFDFSSYTGAPPGVLNLRI